MASSNIAQLYDYAVIYYALISEKISVNSYELSGDGSWGVKHGWPLPQSRFVNRVQQMESLILFCRIIYRMSRLILQPLGSKGIF